MAKINPELKEKLFSADTNTVLQSINNIKEKGNHLYLPILFDLLKTNSETEIKKEILNLLGTVKSKEAIPYFIEALQNSTYKSIRKEILTTCWQNGLEFENQLEIFIDIVANSDWETAFEAFTVVENFEYSPSESILNLGVKKIESMLGTSSVNNEYFLKEILKQIR